jgi:dUTPase
MRDLRVGETVNMQDGPYEVTAVPERGLAVLEPIVRQKTMSLIRHNEKQKVKVLVVRRKSKVVIEPGQYINFYI